MTPRPIIFISAVSKELKTSRQLVANTLHFLGYEPVWQDVFGTEQGDVRAMLRQKIDACQGVVQLVGNCYGFGTDEPDQEFGRVSYTQYEALYAKARGKKVWYLFLEGGFPGDAHPPEAEEFRELQAKYRSKLQENPDLYHPVSSHAVLETRVLKLRDELAHLRRSVKQWAAAVIVLLLILVAGGIWITHRLGEMNASMEHLLLLGEPPSPTASDWERTPPAAAMAAGYAAPAYAQPSLPPKAGDPFHPQLALSVFGLWQGATRWAPLGPETSLRSGEHFFVRAETFTPGFLYIFEIDSSGNLQWLFPANPTLSYSAGVNPLPASVAVTLPAGDQQAYALDDTVGEERLYAIFSATRWEKLEASLQAAGTSSSDATRHEIESLLAVDDSMVVRTKGIARVENTAVGKEVRQATQPGEAPLLVDLPAQSVTAKGYWLLDVVRFQHLARATPAKP